VDLRSDEDEDGDVLVSLSVVSLANVERLVENVAAEVV